MHARFSRGTSVLAALVLVALLGGVMVAVDSMNQSSGGKLGVAPYSQTAEAGSYADRGYTSVGDDTCTKEKQAAADAKGVQVPIKTDGENVKGKCIGAVLKSPTLDRGKAENYKCTGRVAFVKVLGTNKDGGATAVTVTSVASSKVPEGTCSTYACGPTESGQNKCFEAVDLAGIDKDKVMGYLSGNSPDVAVKTYGADVMSDENISKYLNPNSTESDAINKAFDPNAVDSGNPAADKAAYQAQLDQVKAEQRKLDDIISNCAFSGGECGDQTIEDLQKQKADLAAREQTLQKQLNDIQAGGVKTLDPSTVGSLQAQCDAGNCDAKDFQTLAAYKAQEDAKQRYENLKKQCDAGGCDARDLQNLNTLKKQAETPPKTALNTGNTLNQPNGNGGPQAPSGGDPQQQPSSGGLGSELSSILGSLLKGISSALKGGGSGGGQATCTSDQNAYNSQLQAYNQQMQQYNQQLQQYNYQVQIAQIQGYPPPPQPTAPSQPCYTSPTNPNPNPNPSGTQPSAKISCQPKVADVGMNVAISYSCTNATGSSGSGFDTGNALSGSASTTISAPPAGATAVTYGVRCTNAAASAASQCTVEISKPSIILVANPKVVKANASSTIGWITTGMKSCVVSSPDLPEFTAQNATNTSVNGTAITPPVSSTSIIVLHCDTLGGGTRDATTTVQVGAPNGGGGAIQVTSDIGDSLARGSTVHINWSEATTTTGAAISLWLYDNQAQNTAGLIARDQSLIGSYTWQTPAATSSCPVDSPSACASNLVPGRTYSIQAALYSPTNAYLGGYPPANPVYPTYLDYGTSTNFTVSQ